MTALSEFRTLRRALEEANTAITPPCGDDSTARAISAFRRAAGAADSLERTGVMSRLERTLSVPESRLEDPLMSGYQAAARAAINDLIVPEQIRQTDMPTLRRIIDVIACVSSYDCTDLCGPRRYRELARARQLAMLLAAALTPASLAEIGAALGGRDHTTVLLGIRRAAAELTTNDYAALVAADALGRLLIVRPNRDVT